MEYRNIDDVLCKKLTGSISKVAYSINLSIFTFFFPSIVYEFQHENITKEEYDDMWDSLNEFLDKTLLQQNANETLVTPNKYPNEPMVSPAPTYEYLAPETQLTPQPSQNDMNTMQRMNMPSIEQTPQMQTSSNLNNEYTQFFDLNSLYYTPIKSATSTSTTTTNYMIPLLNYSTTNTATTANDAPVYGSVLVSIPTDVATTSAIPSTLMTTQIQVDPGLNTDELSTLNRQLEGGPVEKKKPSGYRCRKRRFGTAIFEDLERVEVVPQVILIFLIFLLWRNSESASNDARKKEIQMSYTV